MLQRDEQCILELSPLFICETLNMPGVLQRLEKVPAVKSEGGDHSQAEHCL
jgi:hypothetical protein